MKNYPYLFLKKPEKKKFKRQNIHKEVNAYYQGTESTKRSIPVFYLKEYYLNILESQQLLLLINLIR